MPPQKPYTKWEPLTNHLRGLDLQPGARLLLTAEELKRILGVPQLPEAPNRVASWDPVMGKEEHGLSGVMNQAELLPVAFEWEGEPKARPRLRWVILVKWGAGVTI